MMANMEKHGHGAPRQQQVDSYPMKFLVLAASIPILIPAIPIVGYTLFWNHDSDAAGARRIVLALGIPSLAQLFGAFRARPTFQLAGASLLTLLWGWITVFSTSESGLFMIALGFFLIEGSIALSAFRLCQQKGQLRRAVTVLMFPLALLSLSGIAGSRIAGPQYVDPFSKSTETVFARAGMPIIAAADGKYIDMGSGGFSTRGLVVRIDEELCRDANVACVIQLLADQPWITESFRRKDVGSNGWAPIGFKLEGDVAQCIGVIGTSNSANHIRSDIAEELPSNETGLWFVLLDECW